MHTAPGSDALPTLDGRSEVGCKSLKCVRLASSLMQGTADPPQHLRVSAPGIEEWLRQRHRRRPPVAKGRQRDFTVGAGTLSRAVLASYQPPSGKEAGSKDRNSGRPDASAVLSERKCWLVLSGHTSFPALPTSSAATLSLPRREYFPCCPRQDSDHHQAMSSPRRLLVNHKQGACVGKCMLLHFFVWFTRFGFGSGCH